jgi:short-subunit dehydrogenase
MVNFKTAVILSRELGKFMCESNWGRIVNIGSSSSYYGFANTGLYCASKHALLGFSRSIHNEFKSKNVRSYCISPSSTKSKMGRLTKDQDYDSFIEPCDVAQYVVFCISFNGNAVTDEVFLKRMEIC